VNRESYDVTGPNALARLGRTDSLHFTTVFVMEIWLAMRMRMAYSVRRLSE
jgi:hypothetical protein